MVSVKSEHFLFRARKRNRICKSIGRKIMVNYKRICKVSCCGLSFEEMVGLILELRF